MSIADRVKEFFTPGHPDECWPWRGPTNGNGYGRLHFGDVRMYAHRAVYIAANGPIPKGQHILHRCDNRSCVNPAHLHVGTNKQNHEEAWERDRFRSRRKLSPTDILEIRSSPLPKPHLAEKYGVHLSHIYQIKTRSQGDGILRMLPADPRRGG